VAALALAAVTAASASATVVPARFSTTGEFYIKAPSGVTVKKNGESAKSCSMVNPIRAVEFGSGAFIGWNEPSTQQVQFTCSGSGPLVVMFKGEMKYDTVTGAYWLKVADQTVTHGSPWGQYLQNTSGTSQWTWVNGSGSTSSTIALNETYVGNLSGTGEKITISGTLTATTLSGGLITLTH